MLTEKEMVSERRQRPRVKSKWPVTVMLSEGKIEGNVENISPVGAFISLEDTPPPGGRFHMIIKPPNRQTLNVSAEIIWTGIFTSDDGESCIGLGVKFFHISETDSQFLHDFISSFYIV